MVDLDTEIYRLLNKQIKINEFRYLSSGDDSDTFLCNEQYVVKVPKRDSVRIAQKREFELYRFLENCNLSYQTPAVVYQSDQFNIMKYIKGERIAYEQYHKLSEKEKDALAKKEEEAKVLAEKTGQKRKKVTKESVMELLTVETIEIEIGYRLVPLINVEQGGDLLERIAQIRRQTALELGIVLPSIRVRDNLQLPPNRYQINLKGVPIENGEVYPERSLAMNALGGADDPELKGISAIEPAFGLPALWIEEKDKEYAEMNSYTVVSPSAVISTHLTEVIKKNASEILSRADVGQLIDNLKKEVSEDYVTDLMKEITSADVQLVIQNLLKERVSIRDLRTILEVMSLQAKVSKNADFLTEQVRQALSRTICKQNLSETGELLAITLAPDVENAIAQGISPDGQSLTLDPDFTRKLLDALNYELEKAIKSNGTQPVIQPGILCSSPIRLPFRRLIERTYPQIFVMSYNEISNNTKAKSVGVVKVAPTKTGL